MVKGKIKNRARRAANFGRNTKYVLLVLLFLVLFGTSLYGIYKLTSAKKDEITYGESFVYKDLIDVKRGRISGINVDFYFIPVTTKDGGEVSFVLRSDPRSLEDIEIGLNKSLLDRMQKLWIVTSPEYSSDAVIARSEIGQFAYIFGINHEYAFSKENNAGSEVISCKNANRDIRVIDVRLGNSTKIYSEGDCVMVEGSDYNNMVRASDRLVIGWLERQYLPAR